MVWLCVVAELHLPQATLDASVAVAATAAAAAAAAAATAAARWAKHEDGPGPNDFGFNERFEFYTNSTAKQIYRDYVAAIVNRYK
jgi:hypothetical protein